MPIDWFTVGAQALNFLILVWLMKRFLYQPILNAIDAREKRIAATVAEADASKAAAKQAREDFQLKNETFEQQRATLLTKATDEANAERQRLIEAAHQAVIVLKNKQQETLRHEAQNLGQALTRRAQDEVFAIARQTLTDLAGTSLEERMSDVFTRQLRAWDGDAKTSLGTALKKSPAEPALVRSAFDLPPAHRATIQQAVNETFSADIPLRFVVAPELIGGIELSANGQKVAWSIADYLTSLEKGVGELLMLKTRPADKAVSPPAEPAAEDGESS